MDLKELREYAEKNGIPVIKRETENLLKILVSLKKPKKILEIGTATGFSASVMLSHTEGRLYTMEIDEAKYAAAKENLKNMGFSQRAVCYLGDASEILKSLTGSYDFIFLDGPKGQYIHFLPYLMQVLESGGLLVCDNVYYRGLVNGRVAMRRKSLTLVNNLRAFLDSIQNDKSLITSVTEIGDGVSVSYKK